MMKAGDANSDPEEAEELQTELEMGLIVGPPSARRIKDDPIETLPVVAALDDPDISERLAKWAAEKAKGVRSERLRKHLGVVGAIAGSFAILWLVKRQLHKKESKEDP